MPLIPMRPGQAPAGPGLARLTEPDRGTAPRSPATSRRPAPRQCRPPPPGRPTARWGAAARGEPGGSPAGNGDGDDGMGWYRYLSGSGPAASGANWPGEDEAGDERSSRLSRRSRGERDQKPGARRGRRARPEPDSDPGAPAGTGFAGPGGTVSSPSGYGPGPAREIGEITAFQPPAPQAPAAFQPPAAPGPPSPSGHLPPGPFGEDRGFGPPDAPTGPQGFAGSGTRDRQDGASGWPSGGSTGISGEAPDAIWSTPANAEWPSGTAPSADTSPGAWPASQATDWPGAPASRHTAEGGRPAGWAQDSGATAAFDMPGSPGAPSEGWPGSPAQDFGATGAFDVPGSSAAGQSDAPARPAFVVAGGRGQRLHCRLARLGSGPRRGHRSRPWLRGCLTQRVAWRRWWPAWRSGSGLWRDGLWRDCRL